jgi:hypothetical protein
VKTSTRITIVAGLVVALLLAGIASFYASSDPDGLNKVASDKGFNQHEKTHDLDHAPLAGYTTHGVTDDRLSGGLAGVVGVVITFAIGGGVAFALRRRGSRASDVNSGGSTT